MEFKFRDFQYFMELYFQKYKSVLGASDANKSGDQPENEQTEEKPTEDEKAKRQAIAAKMRAQALAKVRIIFGEKLCNLLPVLHFYCHCVFNWYTIVKVADIFLDRGLSKSGYSDVKDAEQFYQKRAERRCTWKDGRNCGRRKR